MAKLTLKQLQQRVQRAVDNRTVWETEWDEAYELAFPARRPFYEESPGQNRGARKIYDSTAPDAVNEFASAMVFGLTPPFSEWFRLEPGPTMKLNDDERKKVQAQLDEVSKYILTTINTSNFPGMNHEAFLDLALGTNGMWIDKGKEPSTALHFQSLEQPSVYFDLFAGMVDGRFRCRMMTAAEVEREYKAKLPADMDPHSETRFKIFDCLYRDWEELGTETWYRGVFRSGESAGGSQKFLYEHTYTGAGSCPMVASRWATTSGEAYGRGPLYLALSDARTVNLTTLLTLENAEMAMIGMWQAADDGVINPQSIDLVPGTVIPRDPESDGLTPLQAPGNFNVANLLLEKYTQQIRRIMFNQDLGPTDKTPMSATEVAERQAVLARRIGAPFQRLMSEYLAPMMRRIVYVLKSESRIEMPEVNGREIEVISVSPLARAQRMEKVQQLQIYDATMKQMLGPLPAIARYDEAVVHEFVRKNLELDSKLFVDDAEATKRKQALVEMMQQQEQPQEA